MASAGAAAPDPLLRAPEDGESGEGAGRFGRLEGIAADLNPPGHVYLADRGNARIDEFSPWGEFVKSWGWGVIDGESEELQTCTEASECRQGIEGGGSGQLARPEAIAVDGEGSVYVIEAKNHRVQKFDPDGGEEGEAVFVHMFGLNVNKTKLEEAAPEAQRSLCTVESGDICKAGDAGAGPGQFGAGLFGYLGRLGASPVTGNVFIGEGERVQVFAPGGALEEEITAGCLTGKGIRALAAGPAGKLYVAFEGEAEVVELEPQGPSAECLEATFEPEDPVERPKGLGLDGHGNLYVVLRPKGEEPTRVQEYAAGGECLTCGKDGEGGMPGFDRSPTTQLEGVAATSACEADVAYVAHFGGSESFLRAYGSPPDPELCPQPVVPPEVTSQYAVGAETTSAEIAARINPRFWDDTSYEVEYGTASCRLGGCTETTAARTLTSQVTGVPILTESFVLEGLEPGTTYHYRFVSQSGGGGPVYGIDPDGREGPQEATFEAGLEASFTTYREPKGESCPANESFRTGPSALLPDCRAYELVSPLDKEGGDIIVFPSQTTLLPAVLSQSSVDGNRLAYGSYRAFGDAESAPWTSQYIAARRPGEEWVSHGISPPRGKVLFELGRQTRAEFKAFSDDLCAGWLLSLAELPQDETGPEDASNLLRRSDEECGGPTYEPLNTVEVTDPLGLELQGLSTDGEEATFIANQVLAAGGEIGRVQLYGREGGDERFLCVLPGGGNYAGSCTAGWSPNIGFHAQEGQLANALSADGSRLFWTAAGSGGGRIYLRENPFAKGLECSTSASACTLEVSKGAEEAEGKNESQFWAASEDGSKAIFETDGSLYEYRRADESTHLIADEVLGVMGQSEDLSRIYLASREAKGEANAEGKEAVAGDPNLYLFEEGGFRFIGALGEEDLGVVSPIASNLANHIAQVSPDGRTATFVSFTPLTGYDNTDRDSGEADAEVFLFDAEGNEGAGKLVCASCNPSGARPAGERPEHRPANFWTAARIPFPENVLYSARILSEDGSRLYFESFDALSPRDTNGRLDVYQWEAAGKGGCDTDSPIYSSQNGGCVDLISSGKSVHDAALVDASPDGRDVFFATLSSLLSQDYGLIDIYDARVEGGLPEPPTPTPSCEGEACQTPSPAPPRSTPSSQTYSGPGNLKPHKKKRRCPKGKHKVKRKGKVRCVKNKKQSKRHARHARAKRTGRRGR